MLTFLISFLTAVLVIICFMMVVAILMQKPKSEGLGSTFGGGLTENFLGSHATTFLSKVTVFLGLLFFILTLIISILHVRFCTNPTPIQQTLMETTVIKKPFSKK